MRWPRKKIDIFKLHNWTAYIAISVALLHPVVLLFSKTAGFGVLDVVLPLWCAAAAKLQRAGRAGVLSYGICVVVTSYFRPKLGNRIWKKLHYTAYAAAAVLYLHGVLIDPNLKGQPPDLLDGEKLQVEVCALAVAVGIALRVRKGEEGGGGRLT